MADARSLVRALAASGRKGKITPFSRLGGGRMLRWGVVVAVPIVAAALVLGLCARYFAATSPPPSEPEFTDNIATPLPPSDEFEHLAKTDPVRMYEMCLARYQRDHHAGFQAVLVKKERVEGYPAPPEIPQTEVILLSVRGDVPDHTTGKHCTEVSMRWQSGAKKYLGSEIRSALYSEKPGKEGTDGKVVTCRPEAIISTNAVPAGHALARSQSRYCIRDAGVYRGMLRTYDAWRQRQQNQTLQTEYLGKKPVPELDGRVCHIIERVCPSPEVDAFELGGAPVTDPEVISRDGFTRVRVMIDVESWLQLGTELYRPDGHLLASYFFRNANTNPTFAPDTFTMAGLKAKR